NCSNQAFVDDVIGVDVGDNYSHQVVDIAAHTVDLRDLGNVPDGLDELVEPRFAVIRGLQRDEYGRSQVQGPGIEQGDCLLDDPFFFQPFDAAPTGCLGQADTVGELRSGEAAVFLELLQNLYIELIH